MHRLVLLALIIIAYFLIKGLFQGSQSFKKENKAQGITDEMVEDPACGVYIPKGDSIQRTIAGQDFFFCGPQCAEEYERKISSGKA